MPIQIRHIYNKYQIQFVFSTLHKAYFTQSLFLFTFRLFGHSSKILITDNFSGERENEKDFRN